MSGIHSGYEFQSVGIVKFKFIDERKNNSKMTSNKFHYEYVRNTLRLQLKSNFNLLV